MLPFFEVLRMMAEMEGEKTPDNFHVLPSSDACWMDIFGKCRDQRSLICLEFTGGWSPAARRVQRLFVQLACKTNVPFLRVEIARGSSHSHTAVRDAVGGVTAVPTYAIMNFAAGKVEVHKFEGSTAMENGVFEARLREIANHRERQKEVRQAQMLGEIFSLSFAAAELEALKKQKAEREKQDILEKEQQARLEQDTLSRQLQERQEKEKEERVRLDEIRKEQERRQREDERLKNRPLHVQELLAMNLDKASIREIKSLMEKMSISYVGCTSRQDLATQLVQQVPELRLKREQEAARSETVQVQPVKASPSKLSGGDLKSSTVPQLKAVLDEMGLPVQGYTSKEDMIQAIHDARVPRGSSEQVQQLRAQHAEEKLKSEKERLEIQIRVLEKRLIQSEEQERSLNRDLSETKKQAKAMAERAAAAERRASETAGEITTLKRRNTELESMVQHGSTNSRATTSRAPTNSLLPACFDRPPEEKVKDLERAMLDMTILFTTKAEDYDVLKLIDSGCEGAVHLVRCNRPELGDPNRLYALKTVFNIFGHQSVSKVRQQHENEYQTLAVLPKHPNVINLYAFFFDRLDPTQFQLPAETRVQARSISLFMIMEYQPRTLKTYIEEKSRNGGVQASEVLSWTYQLLMALDFLNAHSVVHRDLKMDNILYSDEGVVKLCDFGFAVQLDPCMKMPFTAGMGKGGNPAHLAPEVHNSRPGRGRTVDYSKQAVWAMGVLCYELCNHPSPFEGRLDQCGYNPMELPPLATIQPNVGSGSRLPASYQQLVKSLLEFEPQHRPTPAEAASKVKSMMNETKSTRLNRF